jgi:Arc/MetJ-type ribon-helix-helix transcriptional regulator
MEDKEIETTKVEIEIPTETLEWIQKFVKEGKLGFESLDEFVMEGIRSTIIDYKKYLGEEETSLDLPELWVNSKNELQAFKAIMETMRKLDEERDPWNVGLALAVSLYRHKGICEEFHGFLKKVEKLSQ